MRFWHSQGPSNRLVVMIDGTAIGAAYVSRRTGAGAPALVYARETSYKIREGESPADAQVRELALLLETLLREGAPELMRFSGSGSVEHISVSLDIPWAETLVRVEHFEGEKPFTFDRALVKGALKKDLAPEGKTLSEEEVTYFLLNGYPVAKPYGKSVRRASLIILASRIDRVVTELVSELLRKTFHTDNISFSSAAAVRYQALRRIFPLEEMLLIFDAGSHMVEVVRHARLVAIMDMGVEGEEEGSLQDILRKLSEQHPLPRTLFLIGREEEVGMVRERLAAIDLNALWFSDNPPKMLVLEPSHVRTALSAERTCSLPLLLAAVYAGNREIDR